MKSKLGVAADEMYWTEEAFVADDDVVVAFPLPSSDGTVADGALASVSCFVLIPLTAVDGVFPGFKLGVVVSFKVAGALGVAALSNTFDNRKPPLK